MKRTDYTHGTLRKEVPQEQAHWAWKLVGMMLAMLALSMAGAWLAESAMK